MHFVHPERVPVTAQVSTEKPAQPGGYNFVPGKDTQHPGQTTQVGQGEHTPDRWPGQDAKVRGVQAVHNCTRAGRRAPMALAYY
jgi:hypothetical protein